MDDFVPNNGGRACHSSAQVPSVLLQGALNPPLNPPNSAPPPPASAPQEPPLGSNIGRLLLDFLHFFGKVFDPRVSLVSVRAKGEFPPR